MTANLAYPAVLALALLMPASVLLRGRGDLDQLLPDLPIFVMATGSVLAFYFIAAHEAYGTARGRLWRLPLTLALGIGMAVNQTRAVIAGLGSADATFVRTPKAGDGAARYVTRLDWTPLVELALAGWFLGAMIEAVHRGWYASLPFMLLFGAGFGYVGLATLLDRPVTASPGRSPGRASPTQRRPLTRPPETPMQDRRYKALTRFATAGSAPFAARRRASSRTGWPVSPASSPATSSCWASMGTAGSRCLARWPRPTGSGQPPWIWADERPGGRSDLLDLRPIRAADGPSRDARPRPRRRSTTRRRGRCPPNPPGIGRCASASRAGGWPPRWLR